jgi:hypothetical protein
MEKLPLDTNRKIEIYNMRAQYYGISGTLSLQEIYEAIPVYDFYREELDAQAFFKKAYEQVCYSQYQHLDARSRVVGKDPKEDYIPAMMLDDTVDTNDFLAKCDTTVQLLIKQIKELQREELDARYEAGQLEEHVATIVLSTTEPWTKHMVRLIDDEGKELDIITEISKNTGISETLV